MFTHSVLPKYSRALVEVFTEESERICPLVVDVFGFCDVMYFRSQMKDNFLILELLMKEPSSFTSGKVRRCSFCVSLQIFFAELIVKIFSSFCLALHKLPILCNIVFVFIVFGFGKAQLICRKICFFLRLCGWGTEILYPALGIVY